MKNSLVNTFAKTSAALFLAATVQLSAFASGTDQEGDFRAPAFSNWIVVVQDGFSAKACAEAIQARGAKATAILETIGIIAVENTTADNLFAKGLECVLAVEPDSVISL